MAISRTVLALGWLAAVVACGPSTAPSPQATSPTPRAVESTSALQSVPMRGLFTYMADAASFVDCGTDRRFPVAMEGDYLAAERAYLDARPEPAAPLLMTVVAHVAERPPMEGDGVVETLVIDRFEAVHPGEDCAGDLADETGG